MPYIVVSHGHDIPWVKPYFLYVLHAFSIPQIKLIVKNSSHLVLLSQALKNNASRFFGESITSKLAVISNGANGQLLPINFVKPQNKILIGFIGRLTQQKNLKLALKALSMVKSCNWQLHVFGDGPQLKNLTSCYAKLIEHKKVVFHGFTKHNQILQFLQKSKLLLITSQSEGFSLVALEAAIKQNYILSTQVSGIDFIEKYNIGKILPNSPKIFAQAIDDFLQNQPNLPTRSIAKNIASDFSWQKVATAYQNLLFKSIKPKL